VLQSRIDVVPGDVVTHDPSTGTDHRAATVLVGGASEEEVEGRMLDLTAWFAGAAVSTPD
jgi:hypothetical protein